MNQIELPELKQLIFKNVDCKNKVEHLIIENHTVDFTWIESNRSYDVIQVQIINILITSRYMRQRPHQDAILTICHKTYILSSSMLKLLTCCKNSEKK